MKKAHFARTTATLYTIAQIADIGNRLFRDVYTPPPPIVVLFKNGVYVVVLP